MATSGKGLLVDSPTYRLTGNTTNAMNLANQIGRVADSNTARSEQQAAELRDWQEKQNKIAMEFNAAEAAKNRDWQQYMSNTAHQREVQDLKLAGLNPVLSAMGGNGAAVTSGATASGVTSSGSKGEVDTSVNQAMVSLLGSFLQSQTNLETMRMSAASNQAIADRNNASAQLIAQINGMYGNERARISGEYGLAGTKYSADTAAAASRANAEMAAIASILNNQNTNATAKSVQESKNEQEKWMAQNYPTTWPGQVNKWSDQAVNVIDGIASGLSKSWKSAVDSLRKRAFGK